MATRTKRTAPKGGEPPAPERPWPQGYTTEDGQRWLDALTLEPIEVNDEGRLVRDVVLMDANGHMARHAAPMKAPRTPQQVEAHMKALAAARERKQAGRATPEDLDLLEPHRATYAPKPERRRQERVASTKSEAEKRQERSDYNKEPKRKAYLEEFYAARKAGTLDQFKEAWKDPARRAEILAKHGVAE